MRAGSSVAVRIVDTTEGFAALAEQWDKLHEQAAAASVFNSWLWQFHWWQHYGAGQPLRILVAARGEEIVGILALYVQKAPGSRVPARILRAVGTGGDTFPDDLGPFVSLRANEPEVLEALAKAALRLQGWDVCLLTDLSPPSPFVARVSQAARNEGFASTSGRSECISFISLRSGWDGFLASLKGERRSGIRRARRKLSSAHSVRFFTWTDTGRLDQAFDKLVQLHRKRWGASGSSESFASPEYLGTHRAIMKSCMARGWLRLYCLEVDGEIAAMIYAYRHRNGVYLMQSGYDPALSRFKLGHVALGYAIEHAAEEGSEVFDFLRGQHRYKDELASGRRETAYVAAFRSTPAAWIYRVRKIHLPRLKSSLFSTRLAPPR